MNAPTNVTFYYAQTYNFPQTSRSFLDAVKYISEMPGLREHSPIKVVINDQNQTLYYNETTFASYVAGSISFEELVEKTQCDAVLRNIREFELANKQTIPCASLWYKRGDDIILVDDDQYICIKLPDSNFISI
jgi:hypothetical protein